MTDNMATQLETALHAILPLVKTINVHIEEARKGYVRVSMSRSPVVINHINAFHAGALYTFAETVAAAAITASFDMSKIIVINKRGEINYRKLVTEKVESEATFSEDEVNRITEEVQTQGKSVFPYPVILKNPDGEVASEVTFDFYFKKPG